MSSNGRRNIERGIRNDEHGTAYSSLVIHHPSFPGSRVERAEEEQTLLAPNETASDSSDQRGAGDHVNRFMLCALVNESAKRIKASAKNAGESLPMTKIVRGVLRSYRRAAKERHGPLAGSELDIAGLRSLNKNVLKDEIARHSRDRVKTSQARLARARRLGDDTKIKAEKDDLERAIELRDRLAERFR